jgi:hypothetical protein
MTAAFLEKIHSAVTPTTIAHSGAFENGTRDFLRLAVLHCRRIDRRLLVCRWHRDADGRLSSVWERDTLGPDTDPLPQDLPRLLTHFTSSASMGLGGSRKGSIGNAVRALGRHAAAAPATVSGEPATEKATWRCESPGKAVKGGDPQARRPATSRGHARTHWAGCPDVGFEVFRSHPRREICGLQFAVTTEEHRESSMFKPCHQPKLCLIAQNCNKQRRSWVVETPRTQCHDARRQ